MPRPSATPVLMCLLLLSGHSQAGQATTRPLGRDQQQLLALKTAPVRAAEKVLIDGLAGEVRLPVEDSSAVIAPWAGRVARVLVDEGDEVQAGQPLVVIASRDYAEARARLGKSEIELTRASNQAKRDEVLVKEGIISLTRAEKSAAELHQARVERETARAALAGLGTEAGSNDAYVLKSPITGVVIERRLGAGQPVEAMAVTNVVAADSGLRLELRLPVAHIDRVAAGDVVSVGQVSGKVTGHGAMIDSATQTVKVRAALPAGSGLLPGQRVTASLAVAAPAHSFSLPRAALVRAGSGGEVYVFEHDTVRAVPVVVVGETASEVTVTGGLEPGEQVVTSGVSALRAATQTPAKAE